MTTLSRRRVLQYGSETLVLGLAGAAAAGGGQTAPLSITVCKSPT